MFNSIISQDAQTPMSWSKTMISVIYKDGDAQLPQNYRPIAIVQVLYSLFTRMLLARIRPQLETQQSRDQAGFKSHFSTEDHLTTLALLQEKCLECRKDLWIAAVDFKKAFDMVTHDSLWHALHAQGVPAAYVHLIAKLYSSQTVTVCVVEMSREFKLLNGVKQGDPMSPVLFNAISEDMFRELNVKWAERRFGLDVSAADSERLTNLRFADDVLLIANSLSALREMISDMIECAAKRGLKLHPDKTKILSNVQQRRGEAASSTASVGGMQIDIYLSKRPRNIWAEA